MHSEATTVAQYLAEMPDDRREAIEAVRATILANVDDEIEEGMQYGMIGYYVPHRVFPAGYHCDPKQPLPYIALASQKRHMAVYLMTTYMDGAEEQWLRESWASAGKKLDMGRSCIRFKRLSDLPLDVLGEAVARVSTQDHIAQYLAALAAPRARPARRRTSKAAKTAAKKAVKPVVKRVVKPAVKKVAKNVAK